MFSQLGSGLNFLFHLLLFLENCLVIVLQLQKLSHSLDRPRICFDFINNLKQKPRDPAVGLGTYPGDTTPSPWHEGFFPFQAMLNFDQIQIARE